MKIAAIKIGVHLIFNGSRRRAPLQVIDLVRSRAFVFHPQARGAVQPAMLRSESRCGFLCANARSRTRHKCWVPILFAFFAERVGNSKTSGCWRRPLWLKESGYPCEEVTRRDRFADHFKLVSVAASRRRQIRRGFPP